MGKTITIPTPWPVPELLGGVKKDVFIYIPGRAAFILHEEVGATYRFKGLDIPDEILAIADKLLIDKNNGKI